MLFATVQCALANVEINAASLKDETEAAGMRAESQALRAQAQVLVERATGAFRARI